MNPEFEQYLLLATKTTACKEVEVIQSLWSGYGKISRYMLKGTEIDSVVVKHIALNQAKTHPRGWNTDIGHQRKVRSYKVETQWYEHWNKHCGAACRTPKSLGLFSKEQEKWIILEDLDKEFPARKQELELSEVKTCLSWLACFHGTFMQQQPKGLWEIGTYWHLATRPEEFEKIEHAELKRKAYQIDELLNGCTYQTIVQGDAKLANFCFAENGERVAAVDFQYVGGGCGMKDLAYFLGSCLTNEELEIHANTLLDYYFVELEKTISSIKIDVDFIALEQEWRQMFPVAWTDFTRFLLGWMPSHQKVNGYSLKLMEEVLARIK